MNATEVPVKRPERQPVHTWFGLSYSNYAVQPRTLLQSMPDWWQDRYVALMDTLQQAFSHIPQASIYEVRAGVEREVSDLDDAELRTLGIVRQEIACGLDHDHDEEWDECGDRVVYDSFERSDMEPDSRVFYPARDPVPVYDRGRAYIEPHLPPQCAVHDEIVTWMAADGSPSVSAGDLIVRRGEWNQVTWSAMSDARTDAERLVMFTLRCDDSDPQFTLKSAPAMSLVAVRRYVEG